jgi:hypothetical protein
MESCHGTRENILQQQTTASKDGGAKSLKEILKDIMGTRGEQANKGSSGRGIQHFVNVKAPGVNVTFRISTVFSTS